MCINFQKSISLVVMKKIDFPILIDTESAKINVRKNLM